jgi:hypothetical protein
VPMYLIMADEVEEFQVVKPVIRVLPASQLDIPPGIRYTSSPSRT